MGLDIRTLIVVLGLTHLIQLVVFIHQFFLKRHYRGVGWWLAWSSVEIASFLCMLARGVPGAPQFVIFAQNMFLLAGVTFLYIGILRFLGQRENRTVLFTAAAVFACVLLYFIYIKDDIALRGLLIYVALALVACATAHALWRGRERAISSAANFMLAVLLLHGAYFVFRAVWVLAGHPADAQFLAPSFLNTLTFLDAIMVGLLWTFGCVMLLNQRSHADMMDAKQEVESLFGASPDAVLLTRLSDGRIVRCNDGFLTMSGYARAELQGKSVLDIQLWNNLAERDHIVSEVRAKNSCTNVEVHFSRKDGSTLLGLMSATVVELDGIPHLIGITHDITPLKQAETERRELEAQNQQLQKSESLGRMAGAIAHHFNNKLQIVMGNLELSLGDPACDETTHASLAAALRASQEAADVSSLMLTYLGRSSTALERLDLSEMCRKGLPLLQASASRSAGVTLETDFATPGPLIKGNANQLQQILTNLVTNAWEASKDTRGAIRVSVKTVSAVELVLQNYQPLDWRPQAAAFACLEVSDQGHGIAAQDLKMIFDPFFSTRFVGRGMGLSVVLGLVRAHAGAIGVVSELGRGSTFRVYIPLLEPVAPPVSEELEPTPQFKKGGTVLLIEDEDAVRELATKMLVRLGFTVFVAQDGLDALDVFQRHKDLIRCVVSDLTMPRMNGWETLAALRKLRPGLPVVLVSGYDESVALAGDHAEQPQAFVSKPFTLQKLRAALESALLPSAQPDGAHAR